MKQVTDGLQQASEHSACLFCMQERPVLIKCQASEAVEMYYRAVASICRAPSHRVARKRYAVTMYTSSSYNAKLTNRHAIYSSERKTERAILWSTWHVA